MFDFGITDYRHRQDKISARDRRWRKYNKELEPIPKRYYLSLRGFGGKNKEGVFYGRAYDNGTWGAVIPGWQAWWDNPWDRVIWKLATEPEREAIANDLLIEQAKELVEPISKLLAGLEGKKDWRGHPSRIQCANQRNRELVCQIKGLVEQLTGKPIEVAKEAED